MPITAQSLIAKSYYLSGVVGIENQTVTTEQLSSGLYLLNEILALFTLYPEMIPYYVEHHFDAIVGQKKYFIPNLVDIETFTYRIDTVRLPSAQTGRKQFFGTPWAMDVSSLPFKWMFERGIGGGYINIEFAPDQAFPLTVVGKFCYSNNLLLTDDISLLFGGDMIAYLRYKLAQKICGEWNKIYSEEARRELESIENKLKYSNTGPDLSIRKITQFSRTSGFNYATASFGVTGFLP